MVDSPGNYTFIADQARTIRIPVHMIETINKLNRISRQMLQEMGREPTPEELGERMDMPEDKVRKVLKIAKEPISMETPIGDDEDSSLGDFIEDVTIASPVESATEEGLTEATREVLGGLTAREAKVLRMRFGIDMNTDHTLEEVGKQFDVTRERIRQIEAKRCASFAIRHDRTTSAASWTNNPLASLASLGGTQSTSDAGIALFRSVDAALQVVCLTLPQSLLSEATFVSCFSRSAARSKRTSENSR